MGFRKSRLNKSAVNVGVAVALVLSLCGCASRKTATPARAVGVRVPTPEEAAFDEIAVMTEAMLLVRRYYVEELAFKDVVYKAIDGMVGALDPNSAFLGPQPLAQLEEDTRGSFGGIGINVGVKDGGIKVIAPIEDSPAFKAGIHSGDTISAVDGKKLEGVSMDEAVKAMRGEKGTPVNVTIKRPNGEKLDVALVRDDIKIASIKGVRSLGDGIGYLRITQFNEPAVEGFAQAMASLEKEKISELIIDLRDNPGGLLESAVGVAEQMLPKGAEIVTVRGRDGVRPQQKFTAGPCDRHYMEVPIAVLVNGGSASASEIVAGALRAHKRAVLVGEKTYGKASVQNVIKLALRPDCALRLTTGYYYTPDGKMIHGTGIEPDVTVVVSKAEWRQAHLQRLHEEVPGMAAEGAKERVPDIKDEQLERAKQVLKGARILNKG